jgi:hypothetical protein
MARSDALRRAAPLPTGRSSFIAFRQIKLRSHDHEIAYFFPSLEADHDFLHRARGRFVDHAGSELSTN